MAVNEYKRVRASGDPLKDEVIRALDGVSGAKISRSTGINASTIYNWRSGKTKNPQAVTLAFALRAVGKRLVIR